MKKKILILGSFGHIGNALCNYLSSKNYQIIATYNKFIDKKKFHLLKKQNIKFIQCDLKNKSKLKKFLQIIKSILAFVLQLYHTIVLQKFFQTKR